jgi:hypothetical protein
MGASLDGQLEWAYPESIDDGPNKNRNFIAFRPERNSGMDSADLLNPTTFVVLEDEVRFGAQADLTRSNRDVCFQSESATPAAGRTHPQRG